MGGIRLEATRKSSLSQKAFLQSHHHRTSHTLHRNLYSFSYSSRFLFPNIRLPGALES